MIKLVGKSLKGKNRIREHGELWEILEKRDFVMCLNGPGLSIKSAKTGDIRWISVTDDGDFMIVEKNDA